MYVKDGETGRRDRCIIKYTVLWAHPRVASRRGKIPFSRRESHKLSFAVRLPTYKRISAGIVVRITFSCQQFYDPLSVCAFSLLIPSSLPKSTRPLTFSLCHFRGAARGHPRSPIIHLSASAFHFRERAYIYAGVCGGKFMNNPIAREGTLRAWDFAGGEKYTCDRFYTPGFTTLRGRGTSRAVNTFWATANFFDCRK